MEESSLITIRQANSKQEAQYLIEYLQAHQIQAKLTEEAGGVEEVYTSGAPMNKFGILIEENDRAMAEIRLKELAAENLKQIPNDYYLFEYTNDELEDILVHHFEWSDTDVLISEKILEERGVIIDRDKIELKKRKVISDLILERSGKYGIIAGYALLIPLSLFSLVAGLYLWRVKHTLPDGKKVYLFNSNARKHGKVIFVLACIVIPIFIILKISEKIQILY